MPITKSVEKSLRQSARRRVRNIQRKKKAKSAIKEFERAILKKDFETAKSLLPKVYKAMDKNVKTNTIKRNTANRTKSHLSKQLNKAITTS